MSEEIIHGELICCESLMKRMLKLKMFDYVKLNELNFIIIKSIREVFSIAFSLRRFVTHLQQIPVESPYFRYFRLPKR